MCFVNVVSYSLNKFVHLRVWESNASFVKAISLSISSFILKTFLKVLYNGRIPLHFMLTIKYFINIVVIVVNGLLL